MKQATPKQRAFNSAGFHPANTVVITPKRTPATSWWTEARTREEFNRRLAARTRELQDTYGPVPFYDGE